MESGSLWIPQPDNLPGTTTALPFVFVGDAAFPLKTYVCAKALSWKISWNRSAIFNYCLSRARCVIENTINLGIMARLWHTGCLAMHVRRETTVVQSTLLLSFTCFSLCYFNICRHFLDAKDTQFKGMHDKVGQSNLERGMTWNETLFLGFLHRNGSCQGNFVGSYLEVS